MTTTEAAMVAVAAAGAMWARRVAWCGLRRMVGRPRHEFPGPVRDRIMRARSGRTRRCRVCVLRGRWPRKAQHAHHILAAARGGVGRRWNGAALCADCNIRLGARQSVWTALWLVAPGPADLPEWAAWCVAIVSAGALWGR